MKRIAENLSATDLCRLLSIETLARLASTVKRLEIEIKNFELAEEAFFDWVRRGNFVFDTRYWYSPIKYILQKRGL